MAQDNATTVFEGNSEDEVKEVKIEISEERQTAFAAWERSFLNQGDYTAEGKIVKWMKNPPPEEKLREWNDGFHRVFYVVYQDMDGAYNPDCRVFICRDLLNQEYQTIIKKYRDNTEMMMEAILTRCVVYPTLGPREIGISPSGVIYTLYKKIQEASGWNEGTIISKN